MRRPFGCIRPRRPEPLGQRTFTASTGTLEESDGGFEPPQSNCRGPAALANEASGRRGRASPSGLACDHRRHPWRPGNLPWRPDRVHHPAAEGRIRGRIPGRFHALARVASSEPPRTDERSERDLKPPPSAERAPVHSIVQRWPSRTDRQWPGTGRRAALAVGAPPTGAIDVKHRHEPLAGTTTTTRNGTFLTRLPAVTPGPVADVLPPVEFAKSCSPRWRGLRMPDQSIHPAASQDTWPEPTP